MKNRFGARFPNEIADLHKRFGRCHVLPAVQRPNNLHFSQVVGKVDGFFPVVLDEGKLLSHEDAA